MKELHCCTIPVTQPFVLVDEMTHRREPLPADTLVPSGGKTSTHIYGVKRTILSRVHEHICRGRLVACGLAPLSLKADTELPSQSAREREFEDGKIGGGSKAKTLER